MSSLPPRVPAVRCLFVRCAALRARRRRFAAGPFMRARPLIVDIGLILPHQPATRASLACLVAPSAGQLAVPLERGQFRAAMTRYPGRTMGIGERSNVPTVLPLPSTLGTPITEATAIVSCALESAYSGFC